MHPQVELILQIMGEQIKEQAIRNALLESEAMLLRQQVAEHAKEAQEEE